MKFTLNIGLNSSKGAIKPAKALLAVQLNNLVVVNSAVHTSDTEPTLVVQVETLHKNPRWFLTSIERLAVELHQDCIAVYRPELGGGALIGPKAAEWGAFDPKQFIQLDGTRLA